MKIEGDTELVLGDREPLPTYSNSWSCIGSLGLRERKMVRHHWDLLVTLHANPPNCELPLGKHVYKMKERDKEKENHSLLLFSGSSNLFAAYKTIIVDGSFITGTDLLQIILAWKENEILICNYMYAWLHFGIWNILFVRWCVLGLVKILISSLSICPIVFIFVYFTLYRLLLFYMLQFYS